ncbi:MAG: tetratricopeptide repeat protein [Halioglobus sp.]
MPLRLLRPLLAALLVAGMATLAAAEEGQYRSKLIIKSGDAPGGSESLSIEELEKQIDTLGDPYARASAERHLARHYVEQKQYDKAIEYYRGALGAGGLSDIADREMQRELAQVYLLSENYTEAAATLERVLRSKATTWATMWRWWPPWIACRSKAWRWIWHRPARRSHFTTVRGLSSRANGCCGSCCGSSRTIRRTGTS